MRIGIFGGTFNPPHLGHKRLAMEMKEFAHLDKIIIIPDNVPPHKLSPDLLNGEIRMEMCRKTFKESFFDVSDIELTREGKSYTFYTLEHLKKKYPDDELFLIIGSDMVLSFHSWFRYLDILNMVTLCVMSREEDVANNQLEDYISEVLHLDLNQAYISSLEPFEVSSTQIKSMIKKGEDVSHYIEKSTLEYIKEHNYYI